MGRGFAAEVTDNVQYPTGFPLLMLTPQKEASGTGSQNVPAYPRRPVSDGKIKEGTGKMYIKCRLGTNSFTSNSDILRSAETCFPLL